MKESSLYQVLLRVRFLHAQANGLLAITGLPPFNLCQVVQ